jgi:hypothetical protein
VWIRKVCYIDEEGSKSKASDDEVVINVESLLKLKELAKETKTVALDNKPIIGPMAQYP